MSELDSALETELGKDRARIFGAVTIAYASGTKRLLDGSAEITIDGQLFRGEEPDFGVLASLDNLDDGTGDEAPGVSLGLLPSDDDAVLAMTDPAVQGTMVTVAIGAVNEATGLPIGDPFTVFVGEIDLAVHRFGMRSVTVDYECVGGMEQLFFVDEGIRLAPSFHKQVWPGELGMDHVTGVTDTIYWGQDAPNPVVRA